MKALNRRRELISYVDAVAVADIASFFAAFIRLEILVSLLLQRFSQRYVVFHLMTQKNILSRLSLLMFS
jgi:hypothetical protein